MFFTSIAVLPDILLKLLVPNVLIAQLLTLVKSPPEPVKSSALKT
jgi:hypothetical protein